MIDQRCLSVRGEERVDILRVEDATLPGGWRTQDLTGIGRQISSEPMFDRDGEAPLGTCEDLWRQEVFCHLLQEIFQFAIANAQFWLQGGDIFHQMMI